jgi:hypothetical protein
MTKKDGSLDRAAKPMPDKKDGSLDQATGAAIATAAPAAAVTAVIQGLFDTHEARVLGAMGLFVGYICIFFVRVMSFTEMYVGVLGVALITLLLLLLNRDKGSLSQGWLQWGIRSFAVIIFSVLLTSPQLYYAWTVSVKDQQFAAQVDREIAAAKANKFVQPEINVKRPQAGINP